MAMKLQIRAHFATGCYHGKEWPPSPMRLLQALAAGAASTNTNRGRLLDTDIEALCWFERQAAPLIYAPDINVASTHVTSVPNNDDDITMQAWSKKKSASVIQSQRKVRYTMKPTVRRFMDGPILYVWEISESDVDSAGKVANMAGNVHCLGRGIDVAWALGSIDNQIQVDNITCWTPVSGGKGWRIPTPGSVQSLIDRQEARYSRMERREFVDREICYLDVLYTRDNFDPQRPFYLYQIRTLDGRKPYAWKQSNIIDLAALVRHALMQQVSPELMEFVSGNVHEGADKNNRLSWIPLPSIGHTYADGRIRRVMILGPRGTSYDLMRRVLFGMQFTPLEQNGREIALMMQTDEIEGAVKPYLDASDEWISITPVILPGHTTRGCKQPGKLVPNKISQLVLKALEREKYPSVQDIWIQKAPFHGGSLLVKEYRVADYMRYPRFHVRVKFERQVSGPVIAGVGRHFGLGLFAAV